MDDLIRERIIKVLTEDFWDFLGDFEVSSETTEYGLLESVGVRTKDGRLYVTPLQSVDRVTKSIPDPEYQIWKVVAEAWLKDPTADFGQVHSHPKPKLPKFEVRLDLRTPFDPPPKEKKIKNMVNTTIPEREADVRWQLAFKKQWDKWHL